MPEKSPETYSYLTYLWVFGLSALGGAVSFIRKVREGNARAWNFVEFIGEIMTSVFAGVLTFYLCEWSGFSQLATAAFTGIGGHMGSRAIFILEKFFESKFDGGNK
ncbi:MAG: phage holin family protein [Burkholderiaceae bacterium]